MTGKKGKQTRITSEEEPAGEMPFRTLEQLFLEDKDQMHSLLLDMQQEQTLQHIMITYQQLHQLQQTTILVM